MHELVDRNLHAESILEVSNLFTLKEITCIDSHYISQGHYCLTSSKRLLLRSFLALEKFTASWQHFSGVSNNVQLLIEGFEDPIIFNTMAYILMVLTVLVDIAPVRRCLRLRRRLPKLFVLGCPKIRETSSVKEGTTSVSAEN